MRDTVLTRDEVDGLRATSSPPVGTTKLREWLDESGKGSGHRYVSGLRRNYQE